MKGELVILGCKAEVSVIDICQQLPTPARSDPGAFLWAWTVEAPVVNHGPLLIGQLHP